MLMCCDDNKCMIYCAALVNTVRSQVASELEMNCTSRLNTPRFTATARNKDVVNATLSNRWATPPILSEENMCFTLSVLKNPFFFSPQLRPPSRKARPLCWRPWWEVTSRSVVVPLATLPRASRGQRTAA